MKANISTTFLLLIPFFMHAQNREITPEDVVTRIKDHVTCNWSDETVDTFKAGNPKTKINSITVCMFADMQVLKKAVELGSNFIITHEPIFYNHLDETGSYSNDPVFNEKMEFIKKHNLVIFRFHDHIHRTDPDGIRAGMIRKLDLEKYSDNGSRTFFHLPEQTLEDYSAELKEKLNLETVRIIGNPDMKFTKLAIMAGAPGGQRHIEMLGNDKMEVLLAGEAREWETYLYMNDAVQQGRNKAIIFIGHTKSEEAGMKYCAEWLEKFVTEVPIHFIENQLNFKTL
ncbi:Putative GTP cyclohydrolase 1 type 2, NIF3 family [Mariniphaga anaerophila]|uniref:Putative GTP cyclohydrolase 1 type 2, NIF3 family n=1 Tax=Mariniphaga anaerophila TaxID=1484053 RepID=A0A1M5EXR0_9BACT|nr:Nif3-like dinuclear metal center hexameric protein [Mariniphaga anaerophila]SHF84070.1 Putative GTP cyclohydrolase 1 type 2, NIF3 family [Mariniphaga anaerophila]